MTFWERGIKGDSFKAIGKMKLIVKYKCSSNLTL